MDFFQVHFIQATYMAASTRLSLVALALLLPLGGCTSLRDYVTNGFKVGPNYKRPAAPVATEWIDAADKRVRSETDDLSKWWQVFKDPILDSLICEAYNQNLTLRQAGFRVLEARRSWGSRPDNSSRRPRI